MLMASEEQKQAALALAASTWGGEVRDGKVQPIASALSSLVRQDDVSCDAGGLWFAAQADARREADAVQSVSDLGFPVYRPVVVSEVVQRGRKVTVTRSMFQMYFFVKCRPTGDNWHKIRTARHVRRWVTTGDGGWLKVPEGVLDVVRLVESQHTAPEMNAKFVYHFSIGDQVRIKTGPFAHFYAKLQTSVDVRGRIEALVDIFGRATRVEFEVSQLERM